jgi:cytochrome c oxidase subunit 2
MNAPNLSGQDGDYLLRQLRHFQAETRGGAKSLYGWMMNGRAKALPSDRALRDVVAHIGAQPVKRPARTLRTGDAARGEKIYTTCAQCHGKNAEGDRAAGGPRLTLLDDWYIARQLQTFISGERGMHPADTFGQQMRAAALPALEHPRAIDDVIAYIATLP